MAIKFYRIKEPHGYMSNFYRAKIFLDDKWWETTEHYYQAMKTRNPEQREQVRSAKTPQEAREIGQTVELHAMFDVLKDSVMKDCVMAKFVQHPDLKEKLLSTGDEELIEDSPVDWYWGCGKDGTGKNMLGKVLMEIRTALRNDKEKP
jgi:N-glycosidase YbiA